MTIASSQTPTSDGRVSKWKWSGLGTGAGTSIGDWVGFSNFADKTVLTNGTFGTGGSITWQGSINGNTSDAVAFTLHDPAGSDLTSTAAAAKAVLEAVEYIRPICTAGSTATSLDGYMFGRKNPI
jgi:hypothetical protein